MAEIEQLTQPSTIQGPFWNPFTKEWDETPDALLNGHTNNNKMPDDSPGVKRQADKKPQKAVDDEETVRRRDILVSVAVLGELEAYVGENIPPAKIRTMNKCKLDTLYAAYEAKLGQEMTENGMETFVGTAVKAISYLLPIDDQEKLKEDLMENKPLRRSLGRYCAGVAEKWGDLVAFAKVGYDVFKHVSLRDSQESPQEKESQIASTQWIINGLLHCA